MASTEVQGMSRFTKQAVKEAQDKLDTLLGENADPTYGHPVTIHAPINNKLWIVAVGCEKFYYTSLPAALALVEFYLTNPKLAQEAWHVRTHNPSPDPRPDAFPTDSSPQHNLATPDGWQA